MPAYEYDVYFNSTYANLGQDAFDYIVQCP